MIRGLKIYALLILHDVQVTFMVNPVNIIWLVFGIILGPLWMLILGTSPREDQNRAIYQGIDKAGRFHKCDDKRPPFIWRCLDSLLVDAERPWRKKVEIIVLRSTVAPPRCWECHHEAGCEPGKDVHDCHRGTCPYEFPKEM